MSAAELLRAAEVARLDRFRRALPTLSYTAFCAAIDVQLTAAQRAIAVLAFNGEPSPRPGSEELSRAMFGAVLHDVPRSALRVLAAICGGRGGKSYTLEALRVLHLALTVPLTTLAPGEVAVGLIVAPDMRLARQTLRFVAGACAHPLLSQFLDRAPGADRIALTRPDGQPVAIEVLPATAGGSAVRARTLVGAALDEAAFFFDSSHVVNDLHLFEAISPRVVPGGQVMIASTPWLQSGLLYDLHAINWGAPTTAIAVSAPTTLLRPEMAEVVEAERVRDPDNARREFDAIPLPAGTGSFFDPASLAAAADAPAVTPHWGDELGAAADFGFRVNASTLAVWLRRDGVTHVVELLELRPAEGQPLVPSEVCQAFGERLAHWGVDSVVADGHYREAIVEHLGALTVGPQHTPHPISLIDAPSGGDGKTRVHLAARTALNERRARICGPQPRAMRQLREIVAVPISGGGLSIRSPQWATGEHGDLASVVVLALAAPGGRLVERVVDPADRHAVIRRETAEHWEQEQARYEQRNASERDGFEHGHYALEDADA